MSVPSPLEFWPPAASASAAEVDHVIWAFTGVLVLLTLPIFLFMAYCAAKYYRGSKADRSNRQKRNMKIEVSWMLIPFAITLVFFVWAARIYDRAMHPPPNVMAITGIGRMWMWKFEHPGGQWEIDELHVPVGQPVRIDLYSQDVVHDLYIPAIRMQMDAIPGHRTMLWFNANQPGAYRLYCSEFCGTDHSLMAGTLYVMKPAAFQAWLATQGSEGTLVAQGKTLFHALGCSGCHMAGSTVRAPDLQGLYGRPVPLAAGGLTVADDAYIMDKIRFPNRQPIAGYQQKMPSFAKAVSNADLQKLVAYIRSLGDQQESQR